jgi:hypothetical protein
VEARRPSSPSASAMTHSFSLHAGLLPGLPFRELSGAKGTPIFRTPVFSLPMGYRIRRLELYAAQRPACFNDFFFFLTTCVQ